MNHTLRFAVAAVLCALAVWWYLRRTERASPPVPPPVATLDAGAVSAPDSPPPLPHPPAPSDDAPRFRSIDPTRRRAILSRMAAARAARARGTAVPAAAAADPAPLPGTVDADAVLDSFLPLIPSFKDCYARRANPAVTSLRVELSLSLVGDPDVGTLVDSIAVDGDAAFRADPDLATCLRETALAIELPPMSGNTAAAFRTVLVLADDEPPAADQAAP